MLGAARVAGRARADRLDPPHDGEVVVGRPRAEQPFCLLEVVQCAREVVLGRDHRLGAGDVGTGEVDRVLGRLEQGDRAAEVVECRERPCLFERERGRATSAAAPACSGRRRAGRAGEQLGDDGLARWSSPRSVSA